MKRVKKFVIGHKYIYLGTTRPEDSSLRMPRWSRDGDMDFALLPQVLTCTDNKPRKDWISIQDTILGCRSPRFSHLSLCASFHEDKSKKIWAWDSGIENWVDVTDMTKTEIQKILTEKRKRMVAEKI